MSTSVREGNEKTFIRMLVIALKCQKTTRDRVSAQLCTQMSLQCGLSHYVGDGSENVLLSAPAFFNEKALALQALLVPMYLLPEMIEPWKVLANTIHNG